MKKGFKVLLAALLALSLTACGSKTKFKAGTYTGTAQGFGGEVVATVVLTDDAIQSIAVVGDSETDGIGSVAINTLPAKMVAAQAVNIDVVTTATVTSNAVMAAVTAALKEAGVDASKLVPVETGSAERTAETLDADVVIIGAGGAGMSAAIEAANAGKKVILVEKSTMVGGNTTRSTGGMNAAETMFQEASGLADDSVQLFIDDTMKGGYDKNNIDLVTKMAEESADAIAWLDSIGASLSDVGKAGGASVNRSHRPVDENGKILSIGTYLVPILEKAVVDAGVEILFSTEATEIIMTDGVATGIKATGENVDYTINAKAVVVASGGFGGNLEMVAELKPELTGYVTTNASTITGDGIKMATAVGADTVDMTEIQIHPTVVQSNGALITESLRGDGAILVNVEGNRFTNEILTRDVVSANVIAQPESVAWLIVDAAFYEGSNVVQGYVKNGYMIECADYAALAELIGADVETITATMDSWIAAVEAKEDAEFGRDDLATVKYDMKTAPYYAVKIAPGVHHTMGGLKINTNTEVVDTTGNVIPGLYAAGEVTGGVHGGNRLGGNAVCDIVVFGRIAGQNAANYAK